MSWHKYSEEHHKRRRIEELRAAEAAGVESVGDTIFDGGEIVLSPITSFHKAAMKGGDLKEHFTE